MGCIIAGIMNSYCRICVLIIGGFISYTYLICPFVISLTEKFCYRYVTKAKQRCGYWIKVRQICLIDHKGNMEVPCSRLKLFFSPYHVYDFRGMESSNPPKLRRNASASANICNLASQSSANPGSLPHSSL